MNETQMLTIASSMVATLFGALVALIAWGGAKVISKLDLVAEKLNDVAGELHARINGLDRRLTRVETQVEDRHTKGD